jgi:microcompartment protein CcmL/EutN
MVIRAVSEAVAEALVGYTGGLYSLKVIYNHHADIIDALAQDFLKAEPELSLTTEVSSSKEIAEFREHVEDQDVKMRFLNQENDGLRALVTRL